MGKENGIYVVVVFDGYVADGVISETFTHWFFPYIFEKAKEEDATLFMGALRKDLSYDTIKLEHGELESVISRQKMKMRLEPGFRSLREILSESVFESFVSESKFEMPAMISAAASHLLRVVERQSSFQAPSEKFNSLVKHLSGTKLEVPWKILFLMRRWGRADALPSE